MNAARQAAVMIVLLAASSLAPPAVAQSSSAMRDCAHLLETPTKDSVTLHALFQVQAATRSRDLPDWFQEDIASAIRTSLRIPQPLGIAAYETDWEQPARTAHPVLRSLLRAVITRDGHIREAVVAGGVRNEALDGALLAAIHDVDSTGVLKTESTEALRDNETQIVISVTTIVPLKAGEPARSAKRLAGVVVSTGPIDRSRPPQLEEGADSLPSFPLFALRTPLLTITRPSRPLPGFVGPWYPENMRSRGEGGVVAVVLVMGADGRAEDGTATVVRNTSREFVQSVMNALPNLRFEPLEVAGCAVRSLEQIPFTFLIR